MKRRWSWILALSLLGVATVTLFLLGNRSTASSFTVSLPVFADSPMMSTAEAAQRANAFELDPMAGGSLDLNLRFAEMQATGPINAKVTATGTLRTKGALQAAIHLTGEIEKRHTASGQDLFAGSAAGTVTLKGKSLPATFVVTAMPAQKKYMITATVYTEEGAPLFLSYGQPYPEYLALLKEKFGYDGQ